MLPQQKFKQTQKPYVYPKDKAHTSIHYIQKIILFSTFLTPLLLGALGLGLVKVSQQ